MSPVISSLLFAVWLLTVGAVGVHFEIESVYCGTRVEALLQEETRLLDQVRRREMKYNKLLSPDLLEKSLGEEYEFFNFPIPSDSSDLSNAEDLGAGSSALKKARTRNRG